MKRTLWLLLFVIAGWSVDASSVFAQGSPNPAQLHAYYRVVPLQGATQEDAVRGSSGGASIPLWTYSVTSSRDSSQRSGMMVGRSPFFHGARETDIPAVIIPIIFKLPESSSHSTIDTFDPTVIDSGCAGGVPLTLVQNSPIFQTFDFTMPANGGINVGTGQYVDEFQRANFWQNVQVTGDRYHTTLSPVSVAPAQTLTLGTASGLSFNLGGCTPLGVVTISYWDPSLEGPGSGEAQTILANLGVSPTTLPIFLFYNVVLNNTPSINGCCILGYHASQGSPTQFYSVADYETSGLFSPSENISAMSHEIGEWMDDPLGNNIVSAWGNIGQVSGCQNNLEVGDPRSGTQFPGVTLGGFTYNPQELAFFSWFIGGPSIGVDGEFSDNGTLSSEAAPCS